MKNQEKDRELAGLIRQALEDHEQAYIPGAWENFVSKRKNERRLFLWKLGSGIAASVLGGWLFVQLLSPYVADNVVGTSHEKPASSFPQIDEVPDSPGSYPETSVEENKIKARGNTSRENKALVATQNKKKISTKLSARVNTFDPNKSEATKDHQLVKSKKIFDMGNDDSLHDNKRSGNVHDKATNAAQETENRGSLKHDSVILADNLQIVNENKRRSSPVNDKIRLGIHFSPGFNSTPSNSSFYFSGGLSADFRLTSALALSTGVQFERQNIVKSSRGNPLLEPVKRTSADLYCLDLPVNLTWKFYRSKLTSYYMAGGLSSLAYIREDYQNKTTTQELKETTVIREDGQEVIVHELITEESTVKESVSSFQSFDLAGRLNLTIGMERHLTPRLHLHVEPYVKIPISGLASQNLKFTTSGITCKISF
ncbi:MAG: porin family protein [Prolixibacteraceae bacterium]